MNEDMIKTVLFSGNTSWSMYNFRRYVFTTLIKEGYNVVVAAPRDEFSAKIEELGCRFVNINIEAKGQNPIKDLLLIKAYYNLLKELNPCLCFFYTIKPNIYGSIVADNLKIPHIAITTGLGYTFIENNLVSKIAKKLYKFAFRKTNQVWFLNNDDKQAFIDENIIASSKAYVLKGGEGICVDAFYKEKFPQRKSFLLVARMLWDKGIGIFVEAAKVLKIKYSDVDFYLLGFIGVDNPSAISKEQIDEWEAKGIIKYLGVTEDVKPYMANSTCVVLPSYYREGIPFSLLEGAAMYRPIIASNYVGSKETLNNNSTGFYCEPKDVDSLVNAMEKIILMTEEELEQMGNAGRNKMENEFNVNIVINQYKYALNYFGNL